MRHLFKAVALSLLVLPLLAGVFSTPAQAFGNDGYGTQYGNAGSCFASAGPNYLGLRCLTGKSSTGDPLTPEEILCAGGKAGEIPPGETKPKNCEKVPECWAVKMESPDQQSLGLVDSDGPPPVVYYWIRCLHGINQQMQITGPVSVGQGPIGLKPGDPTATLSTRQERLVDYFVKGTGDGQVPPPPVLAASPATVARVNTDVSFYDVHGTTSGGDDPRGSVLTVDSGIGVLLRAYEENITVEPTGPDTGERTEPRATCDRQAGSKGDPSVLVGYKAKAGEDRTNTPAGCWYKYTRSSADKPANAYQAYATAHWVVEQSTDGGQSWRAFTSFAGNAVTFDKTGFSPVFVTEVQSINYLPVTGANR